MIGGMTPPRDTSLAPTLGLAEAAKQTGKSVSTIRRRKSELEKLGAVISPDGWRIPIPALVQLGIMDRVSGGGVTTRITPPPLEPGGISQEVADLRAQLAAAEQRAAIAEAIAQERSQHIDDLRQSMLMIEAAKPAIDARPRRWWQRA